MDMCMLDVTGIDVKVGDTVTIFGESPTISELAELLGTIPYEILTSVPRRIERKVIK
jgi:alanine racemase